MTDPGDEHVERVLPAPASVPGITGAGDILPKSSPITGNYSGVSTDILARLEADLAAARRSIDAIRAEIDRGWDKYYAVQAEIRDIQLAIGRAGGGFDTDYYHRRRERSPNVTIRDGFMHNVEDLR